MFPKAMTISTRFNGPPNSGNGGYVCGIIGKHINGSAEVMLRVPPPLDKNLQLHEEGEKLLLKDKETLIGEGYSLDFEVDLPQAISWEAAQESSKHYIAFNDHHFHTCFVCGPGRDESGLRIFAGKESGENVVAAPWIPTKDLFGEDGLLQEEFYWAAMDCPSYFALLDGKLQHMLLGKMAANVVSEIRKDEKIVVMAKKIGSEGRKHYSMTALYAEDGVLKSYSKNLWFSLMEEQIKALGL